MTGADLVDDLWRGARQAELTLRQFVRPLTADPSKFLRQLRAAQQPKPATVERIRALIEGRPVPPPPANNFQKWNAYQANGGANPAEYHAASAHRVDEIEAARDALELRRAIAEAAHSNRRPGETLHDAVRRIAGEQQAAKEAA